MEKGNIARTAEAQGLISVSMHRALHSLEEEVRYPLFAHRGCNQVSQPAALVLQQYCQQAVTAVDRGLEEARHAERRRAGRHPDFDFRK